MYHKTDAVRSASLWFAAGDWRFGPSIEDGTVWAYATSDVLSGWDRAELSEPMVEIVKSLLCELRLGKTACVS